MTEIEEVRMSGAPVATVARPKGAVASLLLATLGLLGLAALGLVQARDKPSTWGAR